MLWADTTAGIMKMRNGANSAWISLWELDGTFIATDISLAAGSAAAPSLFFTGDTNTGIYSPGADQVAVSTGGTARITVDSSGKVGIGTTDMYGTLNVQRNTSAQYSTISLGDFATATNSVGIYSRVSSSGIFGISSAGAPIVFYNAGSGTGEVTRIDSSGRLLVGTSSTSQGNAIFQARGTTDGRAAELFYSGNDGLGAYLTLTKSRGTASSPTEVSNGDDLGGFLFVGYDGSAYREAAYIQCQADGTWTDGGDTSDNPGRLVFSTTADGAASPTERLRIDNQGRHEVTCVKNSNAAFVVRHNGSSDQYGISVVTANDQNNTTNYFLNCTGASSERLIIRSNGGIANYSANNVNLSDRNVKKDITPADDTWDCLKEWEIVNFRYKDQPDDADLNMGVIAQQVAESCPEVLQVFQEAKEATDDQPAQEERIGVKEQQMMWMAIKALQEAQLRIETLEAEVAALKAS
jgi:hypothetical protein